MKNVLKRFVCRLLFFKTHPSALPAAVHCGYLLFLGLAMWAELAAGLPLLMNPIVQSIIASLQEALQESNRVVTEQSKLDLLVLRDLKDHLQPCNATAAPLEQVALQLTHYEDCAETIQYLCPDANVSCNVVNLNNDLLQHLNGSSRVARQCPSSSSSSSSSSTPTDLNQIRASLQCVHCWSQQVAALRR
ncbi:hypothetical protein VZT92_025324 [Zoarces viviparus]|uniref:Uncharacterized protein n=1 Tax=Zoarces viviparus TaxID=48416 RepID=A0AAW1E0W2_ZOAVI